MRIKLLVNLPVDHRHGCFKGRVFEVIEQDLEGKRGTRGVYIIGDDERVKALEREYEIIKEEEETANDDVE